jgi:hypothetical protein
MSPFELTQNQSNLIYRTSYLLAFSSVYGFYKGHYMSIFPFLSFLSSVNHWRDPRYDWKRSIDLIVVRNSITVHSILAYSMKYSLYYYYLLAVSLALYPLSWYFYNKKQYLISTYIHCLYHITCNMGCIILYQEARD